MKKKRKRIRSYQITKKHKLKVVDHSVKPKTDVTASYEHLASSATVQRISASLDVFADEGELAIEYVVNGSDPASVDDYQALFALFLRDFSSLAVVAKSAGLK